VCRINAPSVKKKTRLEWAGGTESGDNKEGHRMRLGGGLRHIRSNCLFRPQKKPAQGGSNGTLGYPPSCGGPAEQAVQTRLPVV